MTRLWRTPLRDSSVRWAKNGDRGDILRGVGLRRAHVLWTYSEAMPEIWASLGDALECRTDPAPSTQDQLDVRDRI